MSAIAVMTKTPADVLNYDLDFSRWLPDADVIVSATSIVETPDVTVVIDRTDFSDGGAKIWVSAGAVGENALISTIITTAGGLTKEVCFRLRIKECH